MGQEKVIESTCGMCFAACGVQVYTANGKVARVKGNPGSPINRGVLCPKGLASVEFAYHPARLKHPLKRIGEKGAGKWAQISWDEALGTIATEMIKVRDKHGPEAVAFIQGSAKGLIDSYNERLANAFGTPNFATTGNVCFLPRLFAAEMTCGSYTVPDYEHPPACIVVWGANLSETRIGEHLRAARQIGKGTELIVVDPVQSVFAQKARYWLQLRPGTDLALALGMIHVIISENLYDRVFVKQFTVGFDRLKVFVEKYSPDRVSKITWVPPEAIENAARHYARAKPACIQWGNALDHGVNSFQSARAVSILRSLTGNIDIPGGDLLPSYPLAGSQALDIVLKERRSAEMWEKRIGAGQNLFPHFKRVLPRNLVDAILEERPYPIHSVYVHASNPLLTYPHASRTYHAFRKLDFLAVADFFMTPTAALADIVLPAATYLEYDSIVAPPYYPFAQIQQKAVQIGECRSDFEITNGLAQRLGLADLFWGCLEEFFDEVLKPAGLSFSDFRKKVILSGPKTYRKYEKHRLNTPSGKIEFYSDQLESWGFDPLPVYREPPETPRSDPELAKAYPLVMTCRKSVYYLHSGGRQIKSLRKGHPEPVFLIHPQTADRFSIKNDQWAYVETRRGRIRQKAVLSDKVDRRVICVDFGWWFPEKEISELCGWDRSNMNILTNDQPPDSRETGSSNIRGLLCRVYAVKKTPL
jgi:anaerobic selenocysteine-containing dehydrogenase